MIMQLDTRHEEEHVNRIELNTLSSGGADHEHHAQHQEMNTFCERAKHHLLSIFAGETRSFLKPSDIHTSQHSPTDKHH